MLYFVQWNCTEYLILSLIQAPPQGELTNNPHLTGLSFKRQTSLIHKVFKGLSLVQWKMWSLLGLDANRQIYFLIVAPKISSQIAWIYGFSITAEIVSPF